MYEHVTFDVLLSRMLARIPDTMDKREGSVIYDACAPAAAEMAQMYAELDINYRLSFVDTASGEYLSRRTAEFGIERAEATAAERRGLFYNGSNVLMDVPLGTRFAIGQLTFVVKSRINAGIYRLAAETAGTVGNTLFGSLLPVDYVDGLARAELAEVLTPGEDEEADEVLRQRFYFSINEPPFGGNVADYKQKINEIPGVGATKVYPAWDGGGTVKCVIIASDFNVPSASLVSDIQTLIDPTVNAGLGIGFAPIGHKVTIVGVTALAINVTTTLTLSEGATIGQLEADVETAISAYLLELRQEWANQTQLAVRTAQIDARILSVPGIEDINSTLINGGPSNLTLSAEQIPQLGTVILNE